MPVKHKIEVFSAGCPACDDAIALVNRIAAPSSAIEVLDMHDATVASRARAYGIGRVPSVVIDGKLADCCASGGPDEATLRGLGIGA
ncbi:MAG: thioredoxin family protein [Magnetospirillum sp.]|nr:thioredoxin family protein [Magnetospirillum sp.]